MIKTITFLIILLPSICFAETSGYLFLGKYLNHNLRDLEGRTINYRAGIYLEMKSKYAILFVQDETLIRHIKIESLKATPKQINYTIGVKQNIGNTEIIIKHECRHLIDNWSKGRKSISYNYIEGRINF